MERFALVLVVGLALSVLTGCGETKDWRKAPRKTVYGAASSVSFGIAIPDGLAKKGDDKVPSWGNGEGRLLIEVVVTDLPISVDAAVSWARDFDTDVFTRRENVPGGFIVTRHSAAKDLLVVDVWREGKLGVLLCNASLREDAKPIPDFDAAVAILEEVCLSMEPAVKYY